MNWLNLLTVAAAFGGAFAGSLFEVRKVRAEVNKIKSMVSDCPHHAQQVNGVR